MSVGVEGRTMARKKAGEPKRNDVTVKMDAEVVALAKMVAAGRGISVAEYLSAVVEPVARTDLEKESARRLKGRSK